MLHILSSYAIINMSFKIMLKVRTTVMFYNQNTVTAYRNAAAECVEVFYNKSLH